MLIGVLFGATGCGEAAESESKTEVNSQSAENLKEFGTPIEDQTFEVTLNDWGKVTFASFAPENDSFQPDGLNPDVRFCLIDNGEVLYEMPGWNEEHTNADLFLAVSAISFKDYNEDGLLDIITLCEYETMSGDGFQTARIYFQLEDKQGFEEDTQLTEYLSKQHYTDSISAIMDAKEDYWNYFTSMNGQRGTYDQILIMAENKEMWTEELEYADEVYQYAVADLDRNGRYEIIVSNMGGTGMYTYSRFFEINENYDGLIECTTDFIEYDSQPDIISEKLETYIDDKGEFHYAVYDLTKNGAAEYYENVRELTLRDGKIITNYLANKSTIYNEETPTITYKDSEGNVIAEEEYINAASNYFAEYQKATTSLGWQDVRELGKDTEEVAAQLDMSLNVFLYSES